jgi:hypothetical protein
VRVHAALLDLVRSLRAGDGGERGVTAKAAVVVHQQRRKRVRAVIGDSEEPAGGIEGKMHGLEAAGRLAVDVSQRSLATVDGEGVGLGAIAMHRIEKAAVARQGEEGRVLEATEKLDVLEGAVAGHAVDVDSLATPLALGGRVAADICEGHWRSTWKIAWCFMVANITSSEGRTQDDSEAGTAIFQADGETVQARDGLYQRKT